MIADFGKPLILDPREKRGAKIEKKGNKNIEKKDLFKIIGRLAMILLLPLLPALIYGEVIMPFPRSIHTLGYCFITYHHLWIYNEG